MLKASKLCLLVVLLCFCIFTVSAFAKEPQEPIAEWNVSKDISKDSVIAKLYSVDGCEGEFLLIVSGVGDMTDFSDSDNAPWYSEYSLDITAVIIESSVGYIGENSFYSLYNLESIAIENPNIILPATADNIVPSSTVIYAHKQSAVDWYAQLYTKNFKILCSFSDEPCICGYKCEEAPPSCASNGICLSCGTTHSGTVSHKSAGVLYEQTLPSCENEGIKEHSLCADCGVALDKFGKQIADLSIPALSHLLGDWIEEVDSTCENEGCVGHYTCSRCGSFFDKDKVKLSGITIPPSHHRGGVATCTELAVCDICKNFYGKYNADNHIYLSEYDYDEAGHSQICKCGEHSEPMPHVFCETVVLPATENSDGIMKKHCDCGYEESIKIPKLSSSYNDETEKQTDSHTLPLIIAFTALGLIFLTLVAFIIKRILKNRFIRDKQGE